MNLRIWGRIWRYRNLYNQEPKTITNITLFGEVAHKIVQTLQDKIDIPLCYNRIRRNSSLCGRRPKGRERGKTSQ